MRSRETVLLGRVATMGILLLVAIAAFAAPKRPETISPEKCFAAFRKHRLGGHEWRSHPEVLHVREVRGRVTNEVGEWPEGTVSSRHPKEATIELSLPLAH